MILWILLPKTTQIMRYSTMDIKIIINFDFNIRFIISNLIEALNVNWSKLLLAVCHFSIQW
jgi:hypothetical protein